ncbi:hypothetical protein OAG1_22680 [Agarivorans sp. OAG1]|uniref:DUF1330 domain-containing protein n=1 Tax=Agarivorans sp. OAG1 TaxID=3082387 RepID=UPI002B30BEA0|nr:hypothetical protein OAG1_22680 [Agarivorans sp. OAG1]
MSYEILVGLQVIDDAKYAEYRAAMKPILADYQGHFVYDFKVSEVLKTEQQDSLEQSNINRVFTINFSSEENKDSFFADPIYQQVKDQYFVSSVASTTIISAYHKAD